jgi:hypothetical protein
MLLLTRTKKLFNEHFAAAGHALQSTALWGITKTTNIQNSWLPINKYSYEIKKKTHFLLYTFIIYHISRQILSI